MAARIISETRSGQIIKADFIASVRNEAGCKMIIGECGKTAAVNGTSQRLLLDGAETPLAQTKRDLRGVWSLASQRMIRRFAAVLTENFCGLA
jgi:hypothetical protein